MPDFTWVQKYLEMVRCRPILRSKLPVENQITEQNTQNSSKTTEAFSHSNIFSHEYSALDDTLSHKIGYEMAQMRPEKHEQLMSPELTVVEGQGHRTQ